MRPRVLSLDAIGLVTGREGTCPVGTDGRNDLGLADLFGNVVEWSSRGVDGDSGRRRLHGDHWASHLSLLDEPEEIRARAAGRDGRAAGRGAADRSPSLTCMSWDDAQAYVTWLSRTTRAPYRLPALEELAGAADGPQPGCRPRDLPAGCDRATAQAFADVLRGAVAQDP